MDILSRRFGQRRVPANQVSDEESQGWLSPLLGLLLA